MKHDANARWQLEPASAGARIWLIFLTAVLPVLITGVALGWVELSGAQRNLVGDSLALTVAVVLCTVLVLGGAIAYVIDRAMRRHRVTVDAAGVEVATTFYKRRLAWSELRLEEARAVNLEEHADLKPRVKTNGTSIPGFKSGWFRLRNREKALVAMTVGPRVAWIPTTQGYGLLLQPRQPQALIDHLQQISP